MSDQPESKHKPITKAEGVTPSEKYLGFLCNKTFLSLWSYPAVYRDEGKSGTAGSGKEVCDLLVVFGDHIVIFSDKHCTFHTSKDLTVSWLRWFRRAVWESSLQLWGAEKWVRQNPSRLFLDRKCTVKLPTDLPQMEKAKFHLVVVAHGISETSKEFFGGSGSLFVDSTLNGLQNHTEPFRIGDLEPKKTFVHVLDDTSLEILMSARDTISDFVAYLEKRAALLRDDRKIMAAGEEEMLALYLTNLNEKQEHDFVFPVDDSEKLTHVALDEGFWERFQVNPRRLAQVKEDRISYMWDALIEKFSYYALAGEQYFVSSGGFKDTERLLRIMAREPRFKRRYLAQCLAEMLATTPNDKRRLRVIPSVDEGDPFYVFLLFPFPQSFSIPLEKYRATRQSYLEACCLVTKLVHPVARDIVGLATEVGLDREDRSEDAIYLDARHWTPALEAEARRLQEKLKILTKPTEIRFNVREYPDHGAQKS